MPRMPFGQFLFGLIFLEVKYFSQDQFILYKVSWKKRHFIRRNDKFTICSRSFQWKGIWDYSDVVLSPLIGIEDRATNLAVQTILAYTILFIFNQVLSVLMLIACQIEIGAISAAGFCCQVAALVPDIFCYFYLTKNHKIANYLECCAQSSKNASNLARIIRINQLPDSVSRWKQGSQICFAIFIE